MIILENLSSLIIFKIYLSGISHPSSEEILFLLSHGVYGLDWTDLAQDRYQWRALVNSVLNLQVP
jgi:hypothetical protein